jgi:hypothetical protein
MHDFLSYASSPAQILGYVAFVLGVAAFLQKEDWKLKSLNACESLAYLVHFCLLWNPAAVVSSALASVRGFLSVRSRSVILALLFIALNLGIGLWVLDRPLGILPIAGSCAATWASFRMKGVPMRCVFLCATACWLANNIASGSIGGTVLELFIGVSNAFTTIRMAREQRPAKTPPAAAQA